MYSKEWILKNDFFKKYENEDIFDSLTGVISRKYIIEYVEHLISTNKQFTFTIVDIDNFKIVNDKFGHVFGDVVLRQFAENISNYTGDDGVVGRYGGDEFIIVYEKSVDYFELKSFFRGMYEEAVFRKTYENDGNSLYVTGTLGCATYPRDASNYDILFNKADKALYRGKEKGRNCYIIYVHEKHKNIDISKSKKVSFDTFIDTAGNFFANKKKLPEKIKSFMHYVRKVLGYGAIFITPDMKLMIDDLNYSIELDGTIENMDALFDDSNIRGFMKLHEVHEKNIYFYNEMKKRKVLSLLIRRIELNGVVYGYIGFIEEKITRIWQDIDRAYLTYADKLILLSNIKLTD